MENNETPNLPFAPKPAPKPALTWWIPALIMAGALLNVAALLVIPVRWDVPVLCAGFSLMAIGAGARLFRKES